MNEELKQRWILIGKKMPSLFFGFFLFAIAILLTLNSNLGMSPWDVLHIGIVKHSDFTLGQVSEIVGFFILLLAWFLGTIPGLGSVCNMIFIGVFIDIINNFNIFKTPETLFGRIVMLVVGVLIMGWATYFYLRVELGAGPRDGLMEGLVKKINKPLWMIRGTIEITALVIGYFLGGPVGVGTLITAFTIGFSVQWAFKIGKYDSRNASHMNMIDLYKYLTMRDVTSNDSCTNTNQNLTK